MKPINNTQSALDFTVKDIDGQDVSLGRYRGNVVLIVNVASKCGFTPQYEDLQQLHRRYAAEGLAILAFPANNFLWQEPGTDTQIRQFCTATYGVEFDLFAKISVKGPDQCDLYRFLTSKEIHPAYGGVIKWNFTKFILNREGGVIARFGPRKRPTDPDVIDTIVTALSFRGGLDVDNRPKSNKMSPADRESKSVLQENLNPPPEE